MIVADARKVATSNHMANVSGPREWTPNVFPNDCVTLTRTANTAEEMGNVPYAAARDSELAEGRNERSTRFGTDASLADDHRSVNSSRSSDARNSAGMFLTNGRVARTRARPTSQNTMVRLRSSRSARTPMNGPRNKPGTTRADRTRPTAVPESPPPTLAAMAVMAISPIQSPSDETTWAIHSREYAWDPNIRVTRSARGGPGSLAGAVE